MSEQEIKKPGAEQAGGEGQEQQIEGFDPRLFDGYDGGSEVDESVAQQLLAGAPPELQARAKEWAEQREKLGQQQDKGAAGEKPASEQNT